MFLMAPSLLVGQRGLFTRNLPKHSDIFLQLTWD